MGSMRVLLEVAPEERKHIIPHDFSQNWQRKQDQSMCASRLQKLARKANEGDCQQTCLSSLTFLSYSSSYKAGDDKFIRKFL